MPDKKHKLEIKEILTGSWQIIDCDEESLYEDDLGFTGTAVASLVLNGNDKLSFPHQIIQLIPETLSEEERWELRFVSEDEIASGRHH